MTDYFTEGSQSQRIDQQTIEKASIRCGEVYYYQGCGGCERSNPIGYLTRDGFKYQCANGLCSYTSEPKNYMIIRNIVLSEYIPGYANKYFIMFNGVCEDLFQRCADDMSKAEAQAYFNENFINSIITARVDIRNPSDSRFDICLSLKDILLEQ